MPGELPLGSLYTYAVDVTVDQAEALGATRIDFDRRVALTVDNFLGFPVGTPVPVGYYDRQLASWVATDEPGIVIGVVATPGGVAELDLDGDGDADADDESLATAAGIDTAERTSLATRFGPTDSFMRASVDHFTPFDLNWLPAEESDPNDVDDPERNDDETPDDETCPGGSSSIIACNNGTLLETIDLAGTGTVLVYDSQSAAGFTDDRTVRVPVTGELIVPDSLLAAEVLFDIAGTRTSQFFDRPGAGTSAEFVWDGLDAFGREVRGATPLTVTIRELRSQTYATGPFGQPPTTGSDPLPVQAASPPLLERVWTTTLTSAPRPASDTIGGWTLPFHHRFDPASGALLMGDGTERGDRSTDRHSALYRLTGAGVGSLGERALTTSPQATGVDVTADGRIVLAEPDAHRIVVIDTDGILRSFAGTGSAGDTGDGGPAAAATFVSPTDVAVGADGSVYVADTDARRIRRILPNGDIAAFAGTGDAPIGTTDGDGGPALDARLDRPVAVSFDDDGSLLIADAGTASVRRVSPAGLITTLAGGGTGIDCATGCVGDEIDLTGLTDVAASPWTPSIAVVADGTILEVDTDGRFRTRSGTGRTEQVAYTSTGGIWAGEPQGYVLVSDNDEILLPNIDTEGTGAPVGPVGGLAAGKATGVADLAVTARGDVVLIDTTIQGPFHGGGEEGPPPSGGAIDGVMLLTSPLRTPSIAGIGPFGITMASHPDAAHVIASTDGSEIYHFDQSGRHLRTLDADTLVVESSFGYDEGGQLIAFTDRAGRVTTIDRTADGEITVTSPWGQRTELRLGLDDLIAETIDPLGRLRTFEYTLGLLASHTNAAGDTATYTYGDGGLLVASTAADGTQYTSEYSEIENGRRTVTSTGNESRRLDSTIELFGLATRDVVTHPDGSTVERTSSVSGSTSTIRRNGSAVDVTTLDDPRFGPMSRYAAEVLASVGDSFVSDSLFTSTTLDVSATDASDPSTVFSIVRSSENPSGGVATTIVDPVGRTITSIDAAGQTDVARYDASGFIVSIEADGLLPTAIVYDDDGRPTSNTTGDRTTTRQFRDANVDTISTPGGETLTFGYDAVDSLVASSDGAGRSTSYTYDALHQPTGWTTAGGAEHGVEYGPNGLPLTRSGLPSPVSSRTYDGARHVAGVTHGDATTSAYTFSGGKLVAIDGPEIDESYTYDFVPGSFTLTSGDLTAGTWSGPSRSVIMDSDVRAGLVLDVDWNVAGSTHGTNFTWSTGLVTSRAVDYSGATRIDFAYDLDRRLTDAGPWTIERGGPQRLATEYRDGQSTVLLGWDDYGSLTSRSVGAAGSSVSSLDLVRDANDRITEQTLAVSGSVLVDQRYTRDRSGFVTEVRDGSDALVVSYDWDIDGNLVSKTTPAGTMSNTVVDGLLATHDGAPVVTDDNGFVTAIGELRLDPAVTGELLSATVLPDPTDAGAAPVAVDYAYDVAGRRVARIQDAAVTRYLYGDPLRPTLVTDVIAPDGTLTQYLYDDTGHTVSLRRDGTWYTIVADAVGTPIAVIDATGTVVDRRAFSPTGELLADDFPDFELEIGFAGGLHDTATGLVRFGQRDYHPPTARWLSPDPIGLAGGSSNLYRYADNDPVSLKDSSGLFTIGGALGAGFVLTGELTFAEGGAVACTAIGGGFQEGFAIDLFSDELPEVGESQTFDVAAGPFGVSGDLASGSVCENVEFDYPGMNLADLEELAGFWEALKQGADGIGKLGLGGSINQQWCQRIY